MHVLVTGSNGFIGKNLIVHLNEIGTHEVLTFSRDNLIGELTELVKQADAVIHLAGENRPADDSEFKVVNEELTQLLCEEIRSTGRHIPMVFVSSTQAGNGTLYGESKRSAELAVERLELETGSPIFIYRLPGVFGKWCKPNYNSVVATFCYNIANDLPIQIDDASKELTLVYIDDVVKEFIDVIQYQDKKEGFKVHPEYKIKLGELANKIESFNNCRTSLVVEKVGSGLIHALYSTYISYLPPENFSYLLPVFKDNRGIFSEIIKTKDSGQFSFFTAYPGVTRGGHYHHSKSEKFLIVKGVARFRFRHIISNETFEIIANGDELRVVDTVPGWIHDITNIGDNELIVMLWANEIFDKNSPDTIACEV
jgi:UDP-2-acetamido-2,6-beta-L-arabino-hexul-4-ose reductase